ncbi:hypothetical protein V6N12_024219 [Hibiscus sabdariffa]|uniref:Uncharacterized protein n=1 Tax=Hibiscus sabdariffa TaxID=183260 RepID=A0ABR2G0S4_9ROSI
MDLCDGVAAYETPASCAFSSPELHVIPPSEQTQSTAPAVEHSSTYEASTDHIVSDSAGVLAHDEAEFQSVAPAGNVSPSLPIESTSPTQGNGDDDSTQAEAVEPSPAVSNTHTMVTRSKAESSSVLTPLLELHKFAPS